MSNRKNIFATVFLVMIMMFSVPVLATGNWHRGGGHCGGPRGGGSCSGPHCGY